jgi:hypothetical protein
MTATLTLTDRPGTVTINDPTTVRQIAEAVAAHNRGEGDRQLRIPRPSPSQHIRRLIAFSASQVAALNADGIDLVDLGSPFAQAEAVAA